MMSAEAIGDIPAGEQCVIIPRAVYDSLVDMLTDFMIERESADRLRNMGPGGITLEELMRESGISQEQLDAMPEVELE